MSNFIEYLDDKYISECEKNGIEKNDKSFVCNIPFRVNLYGTINRNYIIRKSKLTRFLYIKDGCRVYFTDADILMMLLQVKNQATMDTFVEKLVHAYYDELEQYYIHIGKTEYEMWGIGKVEDEQILKNPQDIDISFNELLVLINLILSKDKASIPLWPSRPDFLKHTLSKYITLIKYYYYGNEEAKKYLVDMGFNVREDIYFNYNTTKKRDEKRGFFYDFGAFEKSGVV